MKSRYFLLFLIITIFFSGCAYVPAVSRSFSKINPDDPIFKKIEVELSSAIQKGLGDISIENANFANFKINLPVFSINTTSSFKPGGEVSFKLPIDKKLIATIYEGDVDKFYLCIFNFSSGRWEKITTHYDTEQNLLNAAIPSLKNDHLDSTLNNFFVTVSFPAREGLISDMFQKNRLVKTSQGSVDGFFKSASKKNCIIIHGLSSNPENMMELLKTVKNFNYYENIIFYQYASGDHIENNAQWLADKINMNFEIQFDIIAHSMGGLVSRYAIEKLGLHNNVNKFVMIGTPNNGGNMSKLAPFVFPKTSSNLVKTFPGVSDLITGSKFLYMNKGFNDFLNTKPKTKYHVISGDIGGNTIVKSDIMVSVASATFLHFEPTMGLEKDPTKGFEIVTTKGWEYFVNSKNSDGFNMLYEHSSLHLASSNNGVGKQLEKWIKAE